MIDPSESNAFARAVADKTPPTRFGRRVRLILGVTLSLVLAACLTIGLFLVGALVVRGLRHGDYRALAAAVAVIALTVVMARGRRRAR